LLQLLDDGRLTDAKGRVVNFKNTIIIMTSNLGSDVILAGLHKADLGFSASSESKKESTDRKIMEMLKERFRPEFLNRIDEIIIFEALTKEDIRKIVDLQLAKVSDRLEKKEIKIEFAPSIRNLLAKQGFDPQFGARPLKRLIQNKILNKLALEIIEGKVKDKVAVDSRGEEVKFDIKK